MPIQIKTMRDLWDKDKTNTPLTFGKGYSAEIFGHYTKHAARKQAFMQHRKEMAKIFSDYKKRLGRGGFL